MACFMFHVTVSCHRGPYGCVRVTFELEPTTSLCAWIRGLHTLRIHRRTARDLEYSIQPESGSAASAERARTLRNVGELGEGSEKEDRTDVNWAGRTREEGRKEGEGMRLDRAGVTRSGPGTSASVEHAKLLSGVPRLIHSATRPLLGTRYVRPFLLLLLLGLSVSCLSVCRPSLPSQAIFLYIRHHRHRSRPTP
jgi:hypothetical protein